MNAFVNGEIDAAQAMIYNEYAQVLEAINPDTGELYQAEDLTVISMESAGTAMLQDAIFASEAWLAEEGNEDVAVRFLKASFRGWMHCRDNIDECVQIVLKYDAALPKGHQTWQLNEINALIWPSPDGIGIMDPDLWQQTVDVSLEAGIIEAAPPAEAYRTDLAQAALDEIAEEHTGAGFTKGQVEVTAGGN
jgi:NitT/TauT family transport system substrate-binding protein